MAVRKKLNKPQIAAICIIAILIIAFAVLLPIYLDLNKDNRALYADEKIIFTDGSGETATELGTFTYAELEELCPAKDFKAIYDTSTTEPVEKTYHGIELKALLKAMGIDLEGKERVVFKGADGATKSYRMDDVNKDDNVFIAVTVNGKPFATGILPAADKNTEDGGPFVIIRRSDKVSQNRMRILVGIEVQ